MERERVSPHPRGTFVLRYVSTSGGTPPAAVVEPHDLQLHTFVLVSTYIRYGYSFHT
jgi:hypothetical protein